MCSELPEKLTNKAKLLLIDLKQLLDTTQEKVLR